MVMPRAQSPGVSERLASVVLEVVAAGLYSFSLDGEGVLFDGRTGFTVPVSPALWAFLDDGRTGTDPHAAARSIHPARAASLLREIRRWQQIGLLQSGPVDPLEAEPPTGILSALLNVTHRCNLACAYCLMGHPALREGYGDRADTMSPDTARRAVDYLARHGVSEVNLCFFGGEPLLAFPLIEETVSYADATYPGRFRYAMITNGTTMNDRVMEFLGRHRVGMMFSIDGHPGANDLLRKYRGRDRSVFASAFAHYQALTRHCPDLPCKINVTYFHPTLDLARSLRFLLDQGVRHLRFERGLAAAGGPMALTLDDIETVQTELTLMAGEYLDRLLGGSEVVIDNFVIFMKKLSDRLPRGRGCNLGIDYVSVAPTGEVYACHKLIGMAEGSLGTLEQDHDPGRWREVWDQDVDHRPMCRTCWARYVCGGYCATDNLHATGEATCPQPDPCAIIRKTVELSAWLCARLERERPAALKKILGPSYVALRDRPRRAPDATRHFAMNASAGALWDDCDGQRSVAELARRFGERYGLGSAQARLVVRETLARLRREGLVDAPPSEAM